MDVQKIANLLGFPLHGTRTETEVARYLAGRGMGCLRGVEEKVDHAQRMNDPACPRGGLTSTQRRKTFPTERCRQLTEDLRVFIIQVSLTKGISEPGDFVEMRLHFFGDILRRTTFGHR